MDAEASAPPAPRGPRFNPFAFPSDTDLRFVLLVAAIVGVSLFMYYSLSFRLTSGYSQAAQECSRAAGSESQQGALNVVECLSPTDRQTALWPIFGAAAVLGLAALFYWLAPGWKIRRDGLEPFIEDDDPELITLIAELSHLAGLDRPPTILTNADMSPSGLAFGKFGRYYLVLNAGLIMQYAFDPPAFRAVVLHEMAHLRNGDVDKTYYALAAGTAVLIAAVLPYLLIVVVSELLKGHFLDMLNQLWRVGVALALIYAPIAGILRARELYADVRASAWDGPGGGLRTALAQLEPTMPGLWSAVDLHPSPETRKHAVDDPRLLLGLRFWDAFAIGVAATVAYPDLTLMLGLLTSGQALHTYVPLFSGLLFGGLAASVVGTGVWRATFGGIAEHRLRANLNALALGLGLGMILGLSVSVTGSLGARPGTFEGLGLWISIIWVVLLMVSLRLVLGWVADGARIWIGVAIARGEPRLAYLAGITLTAVLLGGWLSLLLAGRDLAMGFFAGPGGAELLQMLGPALAYTTAVQLFPHPLAFAALIGLWAFPLGAVVWLRLDHTPPTRRWFWLDESEEPLLVVDPSRPRILRSLTLGLGGGIASCLILILIRNLTPEAFVISDASSFLEVIIRECQIAIGLQVAIALVAGWRINRLAVVHGLLSLSIAGGIIGAALAGVHHVNAQDYPWDFVMIQLAAATTASAVIVLPVLWLSALCSRFIERMMDYWRGRRIVVSS